MCMHVSTHAGVRECDPSSHTFKVEGHDGCVHLECLCQIAGSLILNVVSCECAYRLVHVPMREYAICCKVLPRLRFVMPVFTLSASARSQALSFPIAFPVNVHTG